MEEILESQKCKCCGGTGIQFNQKTGLVQECPCYFGSGKKKAERIIYEIGG